MDSRSLRHHADLRAAGLTEYEIRQAIRSAELTAVRPGAYVVGALPAEAEAEHLIRIHGTVPYLATDAVVSHVSAVVLHGIPLWGMSLAQVSVTRNRRGGGRHGTRVHVHAAPLEPDEIATVGGVAVTSPARTVVDVARRVPFEQAVVVADAALRLGLVTAAELDEAVERASGRPGLSRARRVVRFADARSESVGESRSRVAIHRSGLPAPDLQVEVRDRSGRLLARCDFGWDEHRVVGEFDGRQKYGRLLKPGQDPGDAVYQEKLREDAVRATDRTMVRWAWADLDRFGSTAARLRQVLGQTG